MTFQRGTHAEHCEKKTVFMEMYSNQIMNDEFEDSMQNEREAYWPVFIGECFLASFK